MAQAGLDRLQEQFGQLVRERFPGVTVQRVAVLGYGDDPEIEPGQLLARVYLEAGGEQADRERVMQEFHHAHDEALRELRRDLDRLPGVGLLEVMPAGEEEAGCRGPRLRLLVKGGPAPAGEGQLVPVMARLGPADLETVDVLITAGIAANRAEAVRWALARIRERPAYAQLQQRAREIEELKTQF
ncbi:MAG TPA: hypothetical protein VFJ07_21800 [Streptosporangiaceae bacterium]|nr:hypothetical protein [Streptosporangiaceae bacterium]